MKKHGKAKINKLIENINVLKKTCPKILFGGDDITKILIKSSKYTGNELSENLYEHRIEDERNNEKSVLLLCGIGTDKKKLDRLAKVLRKM